MPNIRFTTAEEARPYLDAIPDKIEDHHVTETVHLNTPTLVDTMESLVTDGTLKPY